MVLGDSRAGSRVSFRARFARASFALDTSAGMTLPAIEKCFVRCETVLVSLGVLATFAMMCLTSADALSRYLLNRPIIGAYEITEKYLMVAAIFLGLSYAFRGGVFIRVTFLIDRLPPALKLFANLAAHLLSIAFCVIILIATTQQAIRALSDDTELSSLPILVGPAYWIVPLGFLALMLAMLLDLRRVRTGQSLLFREEAPSA
jgi:TRAP-type C4-dicarboxylate transport system permease small subunit